ncbi:MAG: hypothetical protein LUG18_12425 [Candidatus Azobacteroides sp.]|nr:hypothetical protein [Candidatus Azobacteroides sp.]
MKRLLTYIISWLLLLPGACTEDNEFDRVNGGQHSKDSISISLNFLLPGQTIPKTYAISENAENHIKNLDVLAFIIDPDDNTEKFSYRSEGELTTDNGAEKIFKVTLLKSTEKYRFVFLSNAKQELDQLGNIEKGTRKEDIVGNLLFRNSAKWEADSDTQFTPFPMWGESQSITINENLTSINDIKLTRMTARMDVALTTDEAKTAFQLESVYIFNRKTRGHIVPNTTSGYWEDGKAAKATMPADNEENNPLTVVEPIYYIKDPGADVTFFQEIYTFEAEAPASGNANEATCLVIGGIFEDDAKPTYYRIDFLESDKKTYKDILRNHLYRVNIVKVEGSGHETPEEAFDAKNMNMEAEIVMWEQGEMKDIVFDGQYLLSVSQSEYKFSGGGKIQNELLIFTDYPKGWQASIADDITWIKNIEPQAGEANTKSTLKFDVDKNDTEFERTANLIITAGRLNYLVKIIQSPEGDFMLEVTDELHNPVTELIFPSKVHLPFARMEQLLNVDWDPGEMECVITEMDVRNHLDIAPFMTRSIIGGHHQLNLEATEMTDEELADNPFLEKVKRLDFMVNNGSSYKIESVFLHQINYTIITDEAEHYAMDGDDYSFHAISNTGWTAEVTDDPDHIIQTLYTTSGAKNTTTGELVRFKMASSTKLSATAIITFRSPEGRFDPIEVEINGLNRQAEAQGEANCYMLKPNGSTISIPVSRANADGRTRIKEGDVLKAELLWTDNSNGVSSTGVVADYGIMGSGPEGDLIVTPGSAKGNAVIAVKVNGEIKWSWHIWVTDYNGETYTGNKGAKFMDRNLGAIAPTRGNSESIGLYYQFGRKDPFPGPISFTSSTQIPIYDENGRSVSIHTTPVNAVDNINNGVINPTTFYTGIAISNYDWSTSSGNQSNRNDYLWEDRNGKPTVYDPCPAGWQLPRAYFYDESPWANLSWSGYWNAAEYGANWTSGSIVIGYWPATGYRDATTGALVTSGDAGIGKTGFYWAGNVNSWQGRSFSFRSTSYDPHTNSRKSQGQTIRCIKTE